MKHTTYHRLAIHHAYSKTEEFLKDCQKMVRLKGQVRVMLGTSSRVCYSRKEVEGFLNKHAGRLRLREFYPTIVER